MFNKTMRIIMQVWENDGGTYIYEYAKDISENYRLKVIVKDIIKIDNVDYAVMHLIGLNSELVKFARHSKGVVIEHKKTGKKYLNIVGLY